MRKLLTLFGLLSLLSGQIMHAQQKSLNLDLSSGMAIPKSQVSSATSLINNGFQFSSGFNYLGEKFGLGLNSGYFENPLSPQLLQSFQALPAASDLQFTRDNWQSVYGAIGPVVRFGGKALDWQLSPKLGWKTVSAPTLGSRAKAIGQNQPVVLQPDNGSNWQSFWSIGTKFQLQLSKRLGLHLKADYLSNNSGRDEQFQQVTAGLESLSNRKGRKEVQDMALQIARQKTNVFNLGAGITYNFGKQGSSTEKQEISCENSFLISPINGALFLINGELRPAFNWQNATSKEVQYYQFQLYDGAELVYELKTEKNSLEHDDKLEAIYQQGAEEEKQYSWQVITYFSNCEPATSNRFQFKMSNRSGAFHDIFDLECDAPAYTENGDLRLTGKISFFNNISSSDPLIINTFNDVIIQDASGTPLTGVNLTNITDCVSGLPVPLPITIPPGGTQTFCFKLVVPAGHVAIRSEAHGTINGLPQMSTDQDDLPNCSCTVCDSWRFSGKQSTLKYVTTGGTFFNALVLQDFQIANAAPIREVKAEVVYLEHVANDPQCYTCTKHDNDMGLFSFHPTKPMVILTSGSWKNSKFGYKGPGDAYDTNNDNYVNQVLWKADDPINGVDFSSSSHRFRIPINLPQPSSLDCCDHRYEVCIRYTFTDVNCATCDYLVCYRMSPKNSGGPGTGGLDPATGIDLGGIGINPKNTLPDLRPKKGN